MKSYFKSWTMWSSFLVTLLGAVQVMFQEAPLDPQYVGMITGFIGVAMGALRIKTTQPVGRVGS